MCLLVIQNRYNVENIVFYTYKFTRLVKLLKDRTAIVSTRLAKISLNKRRKKDYKNQKEGEI